MRNRTKKQNFVVESGIDPTSVMQNSPYRMGNWTVTMLKDELRAKHLPVSGKKAELIDRLESGSPIKSTVAPNVKLVSELTDRSEIYSSPLKSVVTNLINSEVTVSPQSPRGRSRSSSPSPHGMLTRSRSSSLTRGTFITWSRQPFSVIFNFLMAQLDFINENLMFFGALIVAILATLSGLFYLNCNYKYHSIFADQLTRSKPVLQVILDGFTSTLGLSRSVFCSNFSKASRFMYNCASGNIERDSISGRLKCSAVVLKSLNFGLGLLWLTREKFVAWTVGSAIASILVFLVAKKGRTALSIHSNAKLRQILNFTSKFAYPAAVILPYETVGFTAGFAGFSGKNFCALLTFKTLIGIPTKFVISSLIVKYLKSSWIDFVSNMITVDFSNISRLFWWSLQVVNVTFYLIICASAIQVIANSRLLKRK